MLHDEGQRTKGMESTTGSGLPVFLSQPVIRGFGRGGKDLGIPTGASLVCSALLCRDRGVWMTGAWTWRVGVVLVVVSGA